MNMYIDRQISAFNTLVRRIRDICEGCLYTDVVQQAMSRGNAPRKWTALSSRKFVCKPKHIRQTRVLNMTRSSFESTYGQLIPKYGDAEGHLVYDHDVRTSAPLLPVPSMNLSRESGKKKQNSQFLVSLLEHNVAVPHISEIHIDKRPGWIVRHSRQEISRWGKGCSSIM